MVVSSLVKDFCKCPVYSSFTGKQILIHTCLDLLTTYSLAVYLLV